MRAVFNATPRDTLALYKGPLYIMYLTNNIHSLAWSSSSNYLYWTWII